MLCDPLYRSHNPVGNHHIDFILITSQIRNRSAGLLYNKVLNVLKSYFIIVLHIQTVGILISLTVHLLH